MIATNYQIDASRLRAGDESTSVPVAPLAPALPSGVARADSYVVATRVRQCPRCRVWVPAESFRIHARKNGEVHRLAYCDECRWLAESRRREKIAQTRKRKAFHRSWSELARSKQQRRAISSIVGLLWDSMGGSKGVARGWSEALKEASAAQKIRSYEGFVRMSEWLAKYPDAVSEASHLSDAELKEEATNARVAAMVELLRKDPAIAADVALRFGYTLQRMGQTD